VIFNILERSNATYSADFALAFCTPAPLHNQQMTSLRGIVKAVPSGDTVVVMEPATKKFPPQEKKLTLTGIVVPRLGNRKDVADEVFCSFCHSLFDDKPHFNHTWLFSSVPHHTPLFFDL
jgi:hypothetical protein